MGKAWYILQTASQYEKRVEREIQTKIDEDAFSGIVTDVRVPVEKTEEIRQGKKKIVERKVWPGYVIVEMDLPESAWREILTDLRKIQGVSGIVGYDVARKERPQPMSAEEAKRILTDSGEVKSSSLYMYQDFFVGQEVKIKDGSFKDFQGKLEEIDYNRKRMKVSVQILGRPTPVEIDFEHVEKI
jgi:transcriptional antiterminator NusG